MEPTGDPARQRHAQARAELAAYRPLDALQAQFQAEMLAFLEAHGQALSRHNPAGHLTASALVLDAGRRRFLLLHHRKLGRWLQPGGHLDQDPDLLSAARREVREETGLHGLLGGPEIFDLDIHWIPERRRADGLVEPRHRHFDVRFLLVCPREMALEGSDESRDLRWFSAAELAGLDSDDSVQRLVHKAGLSPGAEAQSADPAGPAQRPLRQPGDGPSPSLRP
jgi:8-oxo-dGTP pyrophosphatase MutT (NUDIX family)